MTTRFLLAIAILASVAACKIGGDETTTGADAACAEVAAACAHDSDCCSYGCLSGTCAPNPVEGGACHTTPDCVLGKLCKSGACTTELAAMCRDTADVCTVGYPTPTNPSPAWGDCCSGNCEGNRCTVNRAPTADAGDDRPSWPYTQTVQLTNASSDPDGDPLTFGWFLTKPTGSGATLSYPMGGGPPSFVPDVEGPYTVRLVVTEGPTGAPDRYTVEDTVTIDARNLPPVATLTVPDTASRNVAVTLSGSATDPDGDALECAWHVTPPGATQAEIVPATCSGAMTHPYTPLVEGPYVVELVVKDHDQYGTHEVRHVVVATDGFTSVNDAPTPVLTPNPYFANLNGPTPVTLDATASWDKNGDPITFAWAPLEWPGKALGDPPPTLTPAVEGKVMFTPAKVGDYTVQLTVTDPPLGNRLSGDSAVAVATVHVARPVFDLGAIEITDVDVAHGVATGERVVLVGPDPADATKQTGMLWVVDLDELGTPAYVGSPVALGQKPTLVGVSPDGTVAVAASPSWVYIVPLDGSAPRALPPPQAGVSDIVVTGPDQGGKRRAYVFFASATATVQILDIGPDSFSSAGIYGNRGNLDTVGDRLYVRDTTSLRKYTIAGNGTLGTAIIGSYSKPSCPDLWASRNPQTHLFTGCGDVVPVPPTATTLSVSQTLASTTVTHLDTATDGQGVYVSGNPYVINRFSASLTTLPADELPRWSWDGQDRSASARFVFTDGTSRWALVAGSPGGASRPGLVTFP